MKVTPKQYAILLYELTRDKKGAELDRATGDFVGFLARKRAFGLLSRIERLYRDYYNTQEKVVDVEITSAHALPKKVLREIEELLEKHGTLEIAETTNSQMLGGARIRIDDYMLDDTLRARLKNLNKVSNY